MIVRTVQTGGFVYRAAVETTLDASLLARSRQDELQHLVSEAALGTNGSIRPEARDARSIRLSVEEGSECREIVFDDLDPNPARHDLVAFVAEHGVTTTKG